MQIAATLYIIIGRSHRNSRGQEERCTAFVSETRMQTGHVAPPPTMRPDAGDVLPTPVASKAKYCAPKHSMPASNKKTSETSAGIPCKAMPKKRGFGNNDPSLQDDAQAVTPLISPMATAETPATGGKDSYPTTASTPYKAMPDACKRLRASKVPSKPRPQDHSRTAAQATVRFPVDLEEEEDPR